MKKIVRRITFQTVWLNVKRKKPSRSRKNRARRPAAKISNLDTKVPMKTSKNDTNHGKKQLFYVSEQDKPDQCVISDFGLIIVPFPLNTVTFNGQPSRFECGYLEKGLSFESNDLFEDHSWFSEHYDFQFLKPSNRTFHFNDNRILYRLLSRFTTVTNMFWPVWGKVLECAEKIQNFTRKYHRYRNRCGKSAQSI